MNRQGLVKLMAANGVDPARYSVDLEAPRIPDECLCLSIENGGWVVSYSERGQRTNPRWFETEDEACDEMARSLLA